MKFKFFSKWYDLLFGVKNSLPFVAKHPSTDFDMARERRNQHYYAMCNSCDWTCEGSGDKRTGQREIRQHIRDTGHTVQLG